MIHNLKAAYNEIEGIVIRTTDNLLSFIGKTGRPGSELRMVVGELRAHLYEYLRDGSFGNRFLKCFRTATDAGISVTWMDVVLKQLVAEKPTHLAAIIVAQSGILFALSQDGRILAKTKFRSSNDVEAILHKMKDWFDQVKDLASNSMEDLSYRALNNLAAAITRYLADVARPLPRMLYFEIANMPGLAASQYIYGEGNRSEELASENRIVHPAFLPRRLKALST